MHLLALSLILGSPQAHAGLDRLCALQHRATVEKLGIEVELVSSTAGRTDLKPAATVLSWKDTAWVDTEGKPLDLEADARFGEAHVTLVPGLETPAAAVAHAVQGLARRGVLVVQFAVSDAGDATMLADEQMSERYVQLKADWRKDPRSIDAAWKAATKSCKTAYEPWETYRQTRTNCPVFAKEAVAALDKRKCNAAPPEIYSLVAASVMGEGQPIRLHSVGIKPGAPPVRVRPDDRWADKAGEVLQRRGMSLWMTVEGEPVVEVAQIDRADAGAPPEAKAVPANTQAIAKRVAPRYPASARGLGLGKSNCTTKITIDDKGVPTHIGFGECPLVLRESARDAMSEWRWHPPPEAAPVVFDMTMVYKER